MKNTQNRPFVEKMPDRYEKFVKRICGADWRHSSMVDLDGGLGVAICKAILDGTHVNLVELARALNTEPDTLAMAYERLSKNGFMKESKLRGDEGLKKGDNFGWCWIAGVAGGATGLGS